MTPLIDGDIVLCRAGFAVEHRYYTVGVGGHHLASFPYKKDAYEFVYQNELQDDADIELTRDAEPLEKAKWLVLQIMDQLLNYSGGEYRLFVTGDNNFRKIKHEDYKSNRDPNDKPIYEAELKQHLIDDWGAEVVDGMEADDAMGIHQDNNTVICTIDKDLDMVQGLHYNFASATEYYVTDEEAKQNYLLQLLTGDKTDNIIGLQGIGPVRAQKFIHGLIASGEAQDESDILHAIYNMYCDVDREEDFYKNAELLWILRSEDDDWRNHFNFNEVKENETDN